MRVFISSTFYDLKQVRRDLSIFIEAMGYHPLDSADQRFYADPDLHSFDVCTSNVTTADVLVLIIGGRSGSRVPGTRRSITNHEYRHAVEKGIPVFTFVESAVWDLLPVWRANRKASYEPHVVDNKVFLFVDEVRRQSTNNWIWPFRTAQDIIEALKHQWAELFAGKLRSSLRTQSVLLSPNRRDLTERYVELLAVTRHSFDVAGASLVTIARSPGIQECLATLRRTSARGRILILDPRSAGASLRAREEYGTANLLPELRAARTLWSELSANNKRITVRQYAAYPSLFFFRIDDLAHVSFYPYADSSANAPTITISGQHDALKMFQARFDRLWRSARNVP